MSLNCAAFAITDLDLFLRGDNDIKDHVFHAHSFDALFKIMTNFVFVAGIAMYDKPVRGIIILFWFRRFFNGICFYIFY